MKLRDLSSSFSSFLYLVTGVLFSHLVSTFPAAGSPAERHGGACNSGESEEKEEETPLSMRKRTQSNAKEKGGESQKERNS